MPQSESPNLNEVRARVSRLLDALDPAAPVALVELFVVEPARESAFVENVNALAQQARTGRGCKTFSLHKAVNPHPRGLEYLIYEDWHSRDAFRDHWSSSALENFQRLLPELTVVPPDLRFYFGWREEDTADSGGGPANICSSALGFSWAMSVFGAQQMTGLFAPASSKSFHNLKRATEAELTEPFRAAFRAGDFLQRGMLDMARGGLSGQIFDPARWMRMFSNIMQPQAAPPAPPPVGPEPVRPRAQNAGSAPADKYSARPHQSGSWGPMPSSAGAVPAAPAAAPAPAPPSIAEPDISPSYPFEPHYIEVYGSRMHYIEAGAQQGDGETILLLHGNPSWSYAWRNIIPHLSSLGRCIAPDLIGYGKSDKPAIEYLWFDHVRYLEKFIETMRLRNLILVLHDQGSALGLHYAMRHQDNVKAIAFFEALVRPVTWEDFSTPQFRELFRQFRTGGKGGQGWKMIVDQNMFIEQLLPQASGRQLSETEMNYYREPFRQPSSRLPVWQFPRQTAIGGDPSDVWDAVTAYSQRLQTSEIPKLMLYATPGALLTPEHVDWCKQNIRNLQSVDIGPGLHFLEESSPHRIGREIAAWIRTLSAKKEYPSE